MRRGQFQTTDDCRKYHRTRERRSIERLEGMHMSSLPVRLSTHPKKTYREGKSFSASVDTNNPPSQGRGRLAMQGGRWWYHCPASPSLT